MILFNHLLELTVASLAFTYVSEKKTINKQQFHHGIFNFTEMKKSFIPQHLQVTSITMVILLLYLIALIIPDNFWGLHYPAFLSGGKGWMIVLFAIGFTLFAHKYSFWESLTSKNTGVNNWIWIIALTIISGFVFYQLPIYKDVYGDALKIIPSPDFIISEFTEANAQALSSFDFTNLKLGTDTTVSISIWLSYSRDIELQEAFRLIGLVSGMGYVFFMLATAFRVAKDSQQRMLFAFLIVGSPIVLNFCGHIEIYAPVLFLLAVFWFVLVLFFEKPSWFNGAIVLLVCFANIKFHITGIMTFMIFAMALAVVLFKSKGIALTWKKFGASVIGVFMVIGFSIYAFVTKSIFGTRIYTEDNLTDAIFLPVKTPDPAPYDRYNLFSWNHIFDYFNMIFLWSALALIVIIVALVFKRRSIPWNKPLVLVSGLSLICYVLVFFVLNPLLSMPTDWDLMSIPAIALIIFAISIVSGVETEEKEKRTFASQLLAPGVGLCAIGLSGMFVNANQESEANRVITYGKYNFKTYWIGSSTSIMEGIYLKDSKEEQFSELNKAVKELKPYAVQGNDIQYAEILNRMGFYHQYVLKDLNEAHRWYLLSEKADKRLLSNIESLTVSYFIRQDFLKANAYAANLIYNKYPNESKALRMGIHISLEAGDYNASKRYCEQLLTVNPEDVFIREILHLLNTEEDKSKIKFRFRQS